MCPQGVTKALRGLPFAGRSPGVIAYAEEMIGVAVDGGKGPGEHGVRMVSAVPFIGGAFTRSIRLPGSGSALARLGPGVERIPVGGTMSGDCSCRDPITDGSAVVDYETTDSDGNTSVETKALCSNESGEAGLASGASDWEYSGGECVATYTCTDHPGCCGCLIGHPDTTEEAAAIACRTAGHYGSTGDGWVAAWYDPTAASGAGACYPVAACCDNVDMGDGTRQCFGSGSAVGNSTAGCPECTAASSGTGTGAEDTSETRDGTTSIPDCSSDGDDDDDDDDDESQALDYQFEEVLDSVPPDWWHKLGEMLDPLGGHGPDAGPKTPPAYARGAARWAGLFSLMTLATDQPPVRCSESEALAAYDECWEFIYLNFQQAAEALTGRSGGWTYEEDRAEACAVSGKHFKIYDPYPDFVGSILCCDCCEDVGGRGRIMNRCNIAYS